MLEKIELNSYENLLIIYEIAENIFELATSNDKKIRLTARKIIYGNSCGYSVSYEEEKAIEVNNSIIRVFAHVNYPTAIGQTLESCLTHAIAMVDIYCIKEGY